MPDSRPACRVCHNPIRYTPKDDSEPMPEVCGQYFCRALAHWTEPRWRAQLEQARARLAAGYTLGDLQPLDHEAARRLGVQLVA